MVPSDPLVSKVNVALGSPDVRARIREMHAQGYSLTKMVEDLGFEDQLTAPIREILKNLPANVIEGIRQATLEMLDRGDDQMPLDCELPNQPLNDGTNVTVQVAEVQGKQMITVR